MLRCALHFFRLLFTLLLLPSFFLFRVGAHVSLHRHPLPSPHFLPSLSFNSAALPLRAGFVLSLPVPVVYFPPLSLFQHDDKLFSLCCGLIGRTAGERFGACSVLAVSRAALPPSRARTSPIAYRSAAHTHITHRNTFTRAPGEKRGYASWMTTATSTLVLWW